MIKKIARESISTAMYAAKNARRLAELFSRSMGKGQAAKIEDGEWEIEEKEPEEACQLRH